MRPEHTYRGARRLSAKFLKYRLKETWATFWTRINAPAPGDPSTGSGGFKWYGCPAVKNYAPRKVRGRRYDYAGKH